VWVWTNEGLESMRKRLDGEVSGGGGLEGEGGRMVLGRRRDT